MWNLNPSWANAMCPDCQAMGELVLGIPEESISDLETNLSKARVQFSVLSSPCKHWNRFLSNPTEVFICWTDGFKQVTAVPAGVFWPLEIGLPDDYYYILDLSSTEEKIQLPIELVGFWHPPGKAYFLVAKDSMDKILVGFLGSLFDAPDDTGVWVFRPTEPIG